MKRIITNRITDLEPLTGSSEWYWGADNASGDLYEAEELFLSGHPIRKNRLVLVRCPEGTVYEPVRTKSGQYLGRPVYHDGRVVLLMVDFPKEEIRILIFYEATETTERWRCCLSLLYQQGRHSGKAGLVGRRPVKDTL